MKRVLVVAATIFVAAAGAGQTPEQNVAKGFAVDKSYDLKELGSISTFNGNLGVTLPLGLRYQVSSALSYQFVLSYGGNVWQFRVADKKAKDGPIGEERYVPVEHTHLGNYIAGTQVLRDVNAGVGWNLTLGFIETGRAPANAYVSPDGARHLFWSKLDDSTAEVAGVFYTRDGSYLRKTTVDGLTQIEFPDGTRHRFEPATGRLKSMLDRFGNEVTIGYAPGPNCAQDVQDCAEDWTLFDGSRTHKVDMKRLPASGADSYAFDVVASITFSAGTPDASTYTFAYAPDGSPDALVGISRQLAMRQDCEFSDYVLAAVLHSVTLPDGSKYEITTDRGDAAFNPATNTWSAKFVSVDGTAKNIFTTQDCTGMPAIEVSGVPSMSGHLLKIKRPTGATTEWTYQRYSFPPHTPSSRSTCADSACKFAISGRDAVGVKERRDYGRSPALTLLSRTAYAQADSTGFPKMRKTTVSTYENLAANAVPVSSSVHYYSTHFAQADTRKTEYGLPYTDETVELPSTETHNPDTGGRYLSSKVYAGSTLLSYTFLKYDGDRSFDADDESIVNRRVLSERTVHLATDGSVANEIIRTYSDFDGFGHFRTVRTTTGSSSSPAIDRTVTMNYNKSDSSTGELNGQSSEWILNTYSSATSSENALNADGLLERKSAKTLFLFDRSTGFLKRRRTLETIASEVRPASAPVTDPPFTTAPSVPMQANDLVAEYGQTLGNVTSEAYYGGDGQDLGTGALAALDLTGPEFSMTHTYSAGAVATTQYTSAAFKSVDRTINAPTGLPSKSTDPAGVATTYQYDLLGRLKFSAPAGSAATTYVFDTPATARATVTVRQRNGSSDTSQVMTTAVVEYDDLGRVSRETRKMPPTGANSVRETLYNGGGLVASVSEWASETAAADLDRKTTFTYDALGRVLIAKAPDGKEAKTTYSGQRTVQRKASVALETGESDQVTTETMDDLGRLVQVTEPDGTVTGYTYDIGGRLSSVTVNGAAKQPARTFTYDGRGFLTSETHPESGTTTYTYDARGHVTRRNDASELSFTYDAAERLVQVDEGSLPLKVFTFDRENTTAGNVVDRSMGKLATAKRHNRGTPSGDLTVTETYYYKNAAGRVSHKQTTLGTGETFTESYDYDRLGAPVAVTYPTCVLACGSFIGPARKVENEYDYGLLTAVTSYGAVGYAPNGMVTSVTHEKAGGGQSTDTYQVSAATGMARPASITFSGFCDGLSVDDIPDTAATIDTSTTITVTAAGATSYQLFKITGSGVVPMDTATNDPIRTLTVSATAQYFVRVGSSDCTVDSKTFTITANDCPAPSSTITVTPSTVPRNGPAEAWVPATPGATYMWAVEGGTITSPPGSNITFKPDCDAATVKVSVTVKASCGTDSPPASTIVPTGPATTATLSVTGSATIAQGQSKTINVVLTGKSGWTLSWSPSAPSCGAAASSFTCLASPSGTTTYTLTATDAHGCTAESEPLTITVVPPAPFALTATAATATSVQLAWGFSGSTDTFEIQRRAAGGSFGADGSVSTAGATRPAVADRAYLYRVRAVKSGTPSDWSNVDLATTVIFLDDPAAELGLIRAQHILQLRTAANAVRALWNNTLAPFAFTDPSLAGSGPRVVHVQELRDTLNQARSGLGVGVMSFTDPTLTGAPVKAVHVNELRGGVR